MHNESTHSGQPLKTLIDNCDVSYSPDQVCPSTVHTLYPFFSNHDSTELSCSACRASISCPLRTPHVAWSLASCFWFSTAFLSHEVRWSHFQHSPNQTVREKMDFTWKESSIPEVLPEYSIEETCHFVSDEDWEEYKAGWVSGKEQQRDWSPWCQIFYLTHWASIQLQQSTHSVHHLHDVHAFRRDDTIKPQRLQLLSKEDKSTQT